MNFIYFYIGMLFGSFSLWLCEKILSNKPLSSWMFTRSRCDSCSTKLKAIDLLPFIGPLTSKFSCRYCKTSLSKMYLISEFSAGLLLSSLYQESIIVVAGFYILYLMALCDLLEQWVPDRFQVLLLIVALLSGVSLLNFIFSTIVFLGLLALDHLFKNSIGGADIKLLSIISLIFPIDKFSHLLFLSSLFGIIYYFVERRRSYDNIKGIPFVPCILLACWLLYIF